MSFRCENCHEPQASGVQPNKRVVATRDKVYRSRNGAQIGRGKEIVTELNLCDSCNELSIEKLTEKKAPVKKETSEG